LKIGVKLPNSGPFAKPEHLASVALEVEKLGFDSLWVHDHVTRSPSDAEHHFVGGAWEAWERPVIPNVYESVSTLAFVGGLTTRVQLGTSCIVLPLRNPVWLAKMAATIDSLSGGRFILGVGVGGSIYVKTELGAMGRSDLYEQRGAVTDEWIDVIRGVWSEPKFTHHGKFIDVVGAEVYPKPLQSPMPIWIAGPSKIARTRVATRGDGWMPMFLRPHELRQGMQHIREMAAARNRDASQIVLASEHWMSIDADAARAFKLSEATRHGFTEYQVNLPGASNDINSLVGREDETNLIGDPDGIGELVEKYREAGVDHLILRVIAHSVDGIVESLRLFQEAVRARLTA
jgi:probable F420-dependent oxidoreductase